MDSKIFNNYLKDSKANDPRGRAIQIWLYINDVFEMLPNLIRLPTNSLTPLASIDEKYWLLVHGCAPRPDLVQLRHYDFETLSRLDRDNNVFVQMRWNDPTMLCMSHKSKRSSSELDICWCVNEKDVRDWLESLNGHIVIRGHEPVSKGCQLFPSEINPCLITLFTASYYKYDNYGAFALIDGKEYNTFVHTEKCSIVVDIVEHRMINLRERLKIFESQQKELNESQQKPNTTLYDECLTPFPGAYDDCGFPSVDCEFPEC